MKKILLIGEDLQSVQTIKLQLSTHYRVQNVNFMECEEIRFFLPDLIIVYSEAASKENLLRLKKRLINENLYHLPVIDIAIPKEYELFESIFSDKPITIIQRVPFEIKYLLETINNILSDENANSLDGGNFRNRTAVEAATQEVLNRSIEEDEDEMMKKTILVVDDDPVVLDTIKMLMEDDFNVVLVKSGRDALLYLINNKCDLVLLDYMMPDFDGKQTLEMIRGNSKTRNLPVFFLSGISDKEKIKQTIKLNPQGYILKPASKLDIYEKISKYL